MNHGSIAVIIPTSGQKESLLRTALCSVADQTIQPQELWLVTNGTVAVAPVSGERFACTVIQGEENDSLTRLINRALAASAAEYILLMNDDVRLEPKCLANLLAILRKNPGAGMVSAKLLRPDGYTLDSAGQMLSWACCPRERGYGKRDRGQFEQLQQVFGGCGALVLYRRQMLEESAVSAGEYLDPGYHMFYEDLDIAWRARRFGWRAWYTPLAIAYHHRGATARGQSSPLRGARRFAFTLLAPRLQAQVLANRYATLIKNLSLGQALLRSLPIVVFDIGMWTYCGLWQPATVRYFFSLIRPALRSAWAQRRLLEQRLRQRRQQSPGKGKTAS